MTKNLTTHDRKRATLKHMHDVLDQVHHSKLKAPSLHHDFIGIGLITPRMTVELQFPHDGKEKEGIIVKVDRYTFEPYSGRYYHKKGEHCDQVDMTLGETKAAIEYFGLTNIKEYYCHCIPILKPLLEKVS